MTNNSARAFVDRPAKDRALCDIAPTILTVMGVPTPPEMTGKSLVA